MFMEVLTTTHLKITHSKTKAMYHSRRWLKITFFNLPYDTQIICRKHPGTALFTAFKYMPVGSMNTVKWGSNNSVETSASNLTPLFADYTAEHQNRMIISFVARWLRTARSQIVTCNDCTINTFEFHTCNWCDDIKKGRSKWEYC